VRGTKKKKEMRERDGDRAIPLAAVTLNYRRQMFPLIGGGKNPTHKPYKIQRSHICYGSFNNFWERRWAGTKCDT